MGMQRERHVLFTGAALTANQHRQLRPRKLRDDSKHRFHCRTASDQNGIVGILLFSETRDSGFGEACHTVGVPKRLLQAANIHRERVVIKASLRDKLNDARRLQRLRRRERNPLHVRRLSVAADLIEPAQMLLLIDEHRAAAEIAASRLRYCRMRLLSDLE